MMLDQNLASQHPSERFELQVALRRIARAVALLPSVPFARIIGRVDPRLAIARDIAHARRRRTAAPAIDALRLLTTRALQTIRPPRDFNPLTGARRTIFEGAATPPQ